MSSLRLGILSDLHRTTNPDQRAAFHNEYDFAGHVARVEHALAWFDKQSLDALVLCGDLTHTAGEAAMTAVLRECCATLDVPVIAVSGNHDVAHREDMLVRGMQLVANDRLALANPSGEVLAGVRIAGLEVAPTTGYSRSSLRALPAVEDWGDDPVVVLSHLPLLSRAAAVAAYGMPYPGDLLDREDAAAPLRARNAATIVLSGHIHVRDAYAEGPVLQLLQAALIEPPFEATVVDVRTQPDGSLVVTRRTHRTGVERAVQEPTMVDPVGSWHFARGRWEAEHPQPASSNGALRAEQILNAP